MVEKCANPECSQLFDYRQGRLYCCRVQTAGGLLPANSHGLVHYWLCESCSKIYTFEQRAGIGIAIMPRSAVTLEDPRWPGVRASGAA